MFSKSGSTVLFFIFTLLVMGYFHLGKLAKGGLERLAGPILGLDIKIENVDISFLLRSATVENLRVSLEGNSVDQNFIKINRIILEYDLWTLLFEPTILFSRIEVEDPEIDITPNQTFENLVRLRDRWDQAREGEFGRSMVVRELEIKNINVGTKLVGVRVSKSLPDIKLENLGSELRPIGTAKFFLAIVRELLSSFGKSLAQDPRFGVDSKLPEIFQKASEKAQEGIHEVGRELRQGL